MATDCGVTPLHPQDISKCTAQLGRGVSSLGAANTLPLLPAVPEPAEPNPFPWQPGEALA